MENKQVAIPQLGLLKIAGTDAKRFLQGQLTCHMDDVDQNGPQLAAFCQPQGRVIALFYIFKHDEAYYLLLPQSMLSLTIAALKKYAIFFKVTLSEAATHWKILRTSSEPSPSDNSIIIPLNQVQFIRIDTSNDQAITITLDSNEDWQLATIRAGIPTIYPETSGKFLPHDLNLHQLNAISFNKGCYTGQEIIARMQYRGKLKNHLYYATLSSTQLPALGSDVYYSSSDGSRTCGSIVNATCTSTDHIEILVILDESHAKDEHLYLDPVNPTAFLKIQK